MYCLSSVFDTKVPQPLEVLFLSLLKASLSDRYKIARPYFKDTSMWDPETRHPPTCFPWVDWWNMSILKMSIYQAPHILQHEAYVSFRAKLEGEQPLPALPTHWNVVGKVFIRAWRPALKPSFQEFFFINFIQFIFHIKCISNAWNRDWNPGFFLLRWVS